MATPIPTSTSVLESVVVDAPLAHVWHLIKLQDFHKWWFKLSNCEHVKGVSHETDVVKWTFKDGHVLDVKMEEHSVGGVSLPVNQNGSLQFQCILEAFTYTTLATFCSHSMEAA